MHLKKHIYKRNSSSNKLPENFLPMFITSAEKADEFMQGIITLFPLTEDRESITARLREKYPEESTRCRLDLSDLHALGFGMIPLVYRDRSFIMPSRRLANQGEYAIIITNSQEFIARINQAIYSAFPNVRYMEVASVQYKRSAKEIEEWDLYGRPLREKWKQEILLCARIMPHLAVSDFQSEPVRIGIGDLSYAAVCVRTRDLVKGRFPDRIMAEDYLDSMDSFQPKLRGIQGWSFSAMGNVHEIKPTKDWIALFENVLPKDTWKPTTALEKLYPDGDALPRLMFHHVNGADKIWIGMNRVEWQFNFVTDDVFRIIRGMAELMEQKLDTGFCVMAVETNANLGIVKEKWALRKGFVSSQSVSSYEGLALSQKMETDYCVLHNVFGMTSTQRAWHYTVKLSTPDTEKVPYYTATETIRFFENALEHNVRLIKKLMGGIHMPYTVECKNIVEAIRKLEPHHLLCGCLDREGVAVNHQRNDAMTMPDGRVIFLCNTGNLNFYRGENRVYDNCRASLYRIAGRNDRIYALAKSYEFMEFLKTLPAVQEYLDNNLWYEPWAIAQHYEFATPMIDMTNEIAVAAFFATHVYDRVTKGYVIAKEGVGQIRWKTIFPLMDDSLRPIGVQPFSRPSNQYGYGYWISESEDYANYSNVVRFEQDYAVNHRLTEAMTGPETSYFPNEDIAQMARVIRNEKVITNAAIDTFAAPQPFMSPKASRDEIVQVLKEKGTFIVDAPVICQESVRNQGMPFRHERRLVIRPVYRGQGL
jgi:hypothetical protein|nr:FRG domain-containing protein [uncultured Acetatifactor sp.]